MAEGNTCTMEKKKLKHTLIEKLVVTKAMTRSLVDLKRRDVSLKTKKRLLMTTDNYFVDCLLQIINGGSWIKDM